MSAVRVASGRASQSENGLAVDSIAAQPGRTFFGGVFALDGPSGEILYLASLWFPNGPVHRALLFA